MILAADFVVNTHGNFAVVLLLYSLILAIWGLFLFVRGNNPSGGYLGAVIIAEGVGILQGLIGSVVYLQGHRPHDSLHYLYGVVIVLTLPAAYVFGSRGTSRRDSLIFGLAALLLVGLAVRGIVTGRG